MGVEGERKGSEIGLRGGGARSERGERLERVWGLERDGRRNQRVHDLMLGGISGSGVGGP